jgi:hypothetical protein
LPRREFLKTSAGALALAALAPGTFAAEEKKPEAAAPKRALHKVTMWGTVGVKGSTLEKMKTAFEIGCQGWVMTEPSGGDTPEGLKDLAALLGKILASLPSQKRKLKIGVEMNM